MPARVAHLFPTEDSVENLIKSLYGTGLYRESCNLLASAMHRRAGVWWGYCCVMDLLFEIKELSPRKENFEEIEKSVGFEIPEWAKEPESEPVDPDLLASLEQTVSKATAQLDEILKEIPPGIYQEFCRVQEKIERTIKEECGYSPKEVLDLLLKNYSPNDAEDIEKDAPIVKAARDLEKKLEEKRKEIDERLKECFPEEPPRYKENLRDSALDAVWSWINVPNEINTQLCLDAGNACTEQPAGMLALTAFWSFGNLTPTQDRVTPTPPGLAAKGLSALLLQCALHDGGNKSFKERYRKYFEIGFKIACGQDSWASETVEKEAPHRRILSKTSKVDDGEGRFRIQPDSGLFGKDNS